MSDQPILRIATRRSPLAVAQGEDIRAQLAASLGIGADEAEAAFPLITFVTEGDRRQQGSLAEIGGKGLFVKEIELALLNGDADIAVHSMKDMPARMPDGLVLLAVPLREDPRDAFVSMDGRALSDLPKGAKLGTSSVRRAAQVRRLRPDLEIVEMRGNVQTRLAKLEARVADGTFLAEAGLRRLGRDDVRRTPMAVTDMIPAPSQGALCVQGRADDEEARRLCAAIGHETSALTAAVERAFVARLDGSCRTPMAGYARIEDGALVFDAEILTPDGVHVLKRRDRFALDEAADSEAAAAAGLKTAAALADEAGDLLPAILGR